MRPSRRRRPPERSDLWLGIAGTLLAGSAIAFPLHVALYPDLYGPPSIEFSGNWRQHVEEVAAGDGASDPGNRSTDSLDPISTGTVAKPPLASVAPEVAPADALQFRLVAVLDGHAVVDGPAGPLIVQAGDDVPLLGRVVGIERSPQGSVIRFADGRVLASGS